MTRTIAALCAAGALLLYGDGAVAQSTQPAAAPETLVIPFDNPGNVQTLQWLGEGSAELLSEYLERYGGLAVPREERLAAFDRLQLPPAAALSHATVIKVGQIVGASEVVVGSYRLSGDTLSVSARAIRLDTWHLAPEVHEEGALNDVFRIYDAVARRLRGATTPAPPPATGTLLTSLTAFEWYVKGMVVEAPATQRSYLEQAAKAAPSDDRIKLALWRVHTDAGDHQLALAAAASVAPASLLSRSARYLLARSQIELRRYDEAFKTLEALHADTRLAEVSNALGVVQLRRGAPRKRGAPSTFSPRPRRPIPQTPITFSTWATRIGSTRIRRRPFIGCVKRFDSIRPMARPIWYFRQRCSRLAPPPKRRASVSSPCVCQAAPTPPRRWPANRFRAASSASKTSSTVPTAG